MKPLHLDTIETKMPSAVKLYRALGIVEAGRRGGFQNQLGLLDMILDLGASPAH
jgi:hypothetical protein